jgi:hypothetical protein
VDARSFTKFCQHKKDAQINRCDCRQKDVTTTYIQRASVENKTILNKTIFLRKSAGRALDADAPRKPVGGLGLHLIEGPALRFRNKDERKDESGHGQPGVRPGVEFTNQFRPQLTSIHKK